MNNKKKFLDQAGVEYLWSKISMEDYPNNETLTAVINAIDENKADKEYVNEKIENSIITSWNDLEDRPFGIEETVRLHAEFVLDSSKTKYSFYPVGVIINRQKQWLDGDELVFVIDGVAELRVPQSGTTTKIGSIIYDNVRFGISQFKLARVPEGTLWSAEFTATDLTGAGLSKSYTVDARYVSVNVATLDPKFLPEEAQPDWNQNDEDAPNYIKNRPFYYSVVPNENAVVFEQTFTINELTLSEGGYETRGIYETNVAAPGIIDNRIYTITVDGVTYENVRPYKTTDTVSSFGDYSYTNYPFWFNYATNSTMSCGFLDDGSDSHSIRVVTNVSAEYSKMDEGFLPESVAKTTLRSTTEESTKKFDVTVDDEGNLSTTDVETGETKIIGSGSGSAQSDWNQNDETAPDYIKNRPFYTKMSDTPSIPELILEDYNQYSDNCYWAENFPNDFRITEGETYLCYFDGVPYNLIGKSDLTDVWCPYWYLGNGHIFRENWSDTGEPFVIVVNNDLEYGDNISVNFCVLEPTPHTLSVYNQEVFPIDLKYLRLPKFSTEPLTIDGVIFNGLEPVKITTVGRQGKGIQSEVFNGVSPEQATGRCSHVENEGSNLAKGNYTHVEGYGAQALSDYQHVQGTYNIPAEIKPVRTHTGLSTIQWYDSDVVYADDFTFDPSTREFTLVSPTYGTISDILNISCYYIEGSSPTGKTLFHKLDDTYQNHTKPNYYRFQRSEYEIKPENKHAHIVGNGTSNKNRSNAHTIDWNGLGWFKGGLKVGGTGQDDETAVEVATKNDIVQADWSIDDETNPAYVKNKPTDNDILAELIEADLLAAVTTNNKILTDNNGRIILRY